jgi:hypothetical protein
MTARAWHASAPSRSPQTVGPRECRGPIRARAQARGGPMETEEGNGMSTHDVPVQFRGFVGEPANELEVAYLLGIAQEHLPFPFVITSINDGFPDCEGIDPRTGTRVAIELEVRSSHFKTHRHSTKACDYIVCWEDNWPDAPINVVCLKSLFERTPALMQRLIIRVRPGSLRDDLRKRQTTDPATYDAVTHFLDVALPAVQHRIPAVVLDERLTKHFLVRYGTGRGLLGIYPSGRLVCASEKDMVKTYGAAVAAPTRALRAAVDSVGKVLQSTAQAAVVLDALEGLIHVIAQVEVAKTAPRL